MNRYNKELLSNKIPLFTIPIKGAKTTTILVMVKTGSRYENRKNNGISHFLEHLFFKGTTKRPDTLALSSELDSLGGEYNAFTSKEYTGYWIKVTENKSTQALDIVNDMLFNSKFDSEEIEREKGVIIEEINMYEDNPIMHIEDVFEACLYGDTSAGWETLGTKENIRRFKRQDFINYLKSQYGPKSISIILAGAVSSQTKKAVAQIFTAKKINQWKDKVATKDKQAKPQVRAVHKKSDQVNLSLGVRTYPVGSPDEFKIKLLAIILGGAMSSRLFIRLRERSGLAYYVRTNSEFYSDSGYLTTQAGVPTDKVETAVKIILEEYQKIAEEKISKQELKRAKDLLKGRLFLQLETSDNLANYYGRQTILRKNIISPADFLKRINKITVEDLKKVAKKIFIDKNLNLALIGSVRADKFKKILHF